MSKTKILRIICLASLLVFILACYSSYAQTLNNPNIYGYFSTRYEKVWSEPSLQEDDTIVKESAPGEWSFPSFNLMLQQEVGEKIKIYVNIAGEDGDNISLSNFWGEYSVSRALNFRVGKTYRKFGLYNEILDAVPTYYGIEPPELFDKDHLIVSRTAPVMVHGSVGLGSGSLSYSASTDNGEGGASFDSVPFGYDTNYKLFTPQGDFTFGISGYRSGGPTTSDVDVGEGSPRTGVLPWMAGDDFWVFGGYGEALIGNWTLQAALWKSGHDATRDPEKTVTMIEGANPNSSQLSRFLIDPEGPVDESNINLISDYDVITWYTRVGYSIDSSIGEFGPYFLWDYYSNPETIQSKTYGGDAEAGASDDGKFHKWTMGLIYRPQPELAVKFDASGHRYQLGGQTVSYPEVRFDVSYIFGQ